MSKIDNENVENIISNADSNGKEERNVPDLRFDFDDKPQYLELEKLAIKAPHSFAGGPFGSDLKKSDYKDDGVPIIQLSNITESYLNFENRLIYTSKEKAENLKYNNAHPGDLIIAKMMPAGRACIATEKYERYVLGSDAIKISLNKNKCNPIFIREQINSSTIKKLISDRTAGSTRRRIGLPELKKLKLLLPSIDEQNKIGNFLEKIDNRIQTQKKIIEEIKTYKMAICDKLIYSSKNKELKYISDIASLKNGYAFNSKLYCSDGIYKVITITNVTGDRYIKIDNCNHLLEIPSDIQKHQNLKNSDILISLTGNVGRVSMCNHDNCLLNQRVGVLSLIEEIDSEYLYQCLANKRFENAMISKGQGAAQLNIGKRDIETYMIPYVDLSTQNQIAELLKRLDEFVNTEEKILKLYQKQKDYLLNKMFI